MVRACTRAVAGTGTSPGHVPSMKFSPEERELLLATSVFREVTAQRSRGTGIPGLRDARSRAPRSPSASDVGRGTV